MRKDRLDPRYVLILEYSDFLCDSAGKRDMKNVLKGLLNIVEECGYRTNFTEIGHNGNMRYNLHIYTRTLKQQRGFYRAFSHVLKPDIDKRKRINGTISGPAWKVGVY